MISKLWWWEFMKTGSKVALKYVNLTSIYKIFLGSTFTIPILILSNHLKISFICSKNRQAKIPNHPQSINLWTLLHRVLIFNGFLFPGLMFAWYIYSARPRKICSHFLFAYWHTWHPHIRLSIIYLH